MKGKILILVSELWHIDQLDSTLDGTVVALDAEIEEALIAHSVPYISAKEYRTENLDFRDAANAWAMQVLENPKKLFVEYRGVSLGRVYFYQLYLYFTRLAYWLDILASLIERHLDLLEIIVYPSAYRVTETTGDLAHEEIHALVDVAKLVGNQKGIAVTVPPVPQGVTHGPGVIFRTKRKMFGHLLSLWNACMGLRRPRKLRILASDYWRNISPLMSHLQDTELICVDRLQALQVGIGNLWKWRMRFYHLDAFVGEKKDVLRGGEESEFTSTFRGYDIGPLLLNAYNALKHIYVPQALKDIDAAYIMLEILRPSVLLLRISTAPQRHYAILAQVARELGIPSVEFQHGLEYNGNDSFTRRKNAQYLGVYGPYVAQELIAAGIERDRISVIGSPRFDIYTQVHNRRVASRRAKREFNVLCIHPDLSYGDGFDIYDIDAYMEGVADALRDIQDVHLTIKLRGGRREEFYLRRIRDICKDIPHSVEKEVPLVELLLQSDLMVSCFSTAILEAMQSGVASVMYGSLPIDRRLSEAHLGPYVQAQALRVANTPQELSNDLRILTAPEVRQTQVEHADLFLQKAFAFDGRAGERAAKLMYKLASGN